MYKKAILLISIVLVLGLVGNAPAALVGRWTFDDGTASDSSGNSHHGTFMFDATTVIDGSIPGLGAGNKVLTLDGTDDYVNCGGGGGGGTWADFTTNQMTVACWLRLPDGYTNNYQPAMAKSGMWQWYRNYNGYGIRLYTNDTDDTYINYYPQGDYPNIFMSDGEWHHTAATFDGVGGVRHIYIDGYHAKEESVISGGLAVSTHAVSIGARLAFTNRWKGFLDECYLYDHVLTHQEILVLASRFWAFDPNAFDGEQYVLTTLPVLTWRAGAKVAATQGHKVYIGTDKALVDANDALVSKGAVDSNSYTGAPMGSLAFDTTYYWRVNEVNGVNEWPGDVWSFTTVSQKATEPKPVDTSKYVSTSRARVSWKAGSGATNHSVYFGTNETLVTNSDASVYKGTFAVTSDPNWAISPALIADETYYWRIDVNAPVLRSGNVWSFEVSALVSDANLIGWWPMNEEDVSGNVTWDISGNEHHGTFKDDADLIVDASIGVPGNKVLDLDGFMDYVNVGGGKADVSDPRTWADMDKTFGIACWVKLPNGYTNNYQPAVAKSGSWQWYRNYNGTGIRLYTNATADTYINYNPNIDYPNIDLDDGEWHHTASTFDGVSGTRKIWIDGSLAQEESVTGSFASSTYDMSIGARLAYNNRWKGQLDDVRFYNRVLTIEDVLQMMRFDPNKAWLPYPRNLSVDVADRPLTLTWRPGDNVAVTGGHRVYFGTDQALVDACDASVDKSPQDVNYLYVDELPFATTYYWRVDESNGATTWRGVDWTFDMANFKLFEDFESYNDSTNVIQNVWVPVDWTGTVINRGMTGNNDPVNGGEQSMKYSYNDKEYYSYAEAVRDFGSSPLDFSYATGDVKALQLNFYGETGNYPIEMYVVLEDSSTNDSMKLYDGDLDDIKAGEWKEWDIDLSWFTDDDNNVNLSSIKKVYLGFGVRGSTSTPASYSSGTVYFDDFRVYPPRCVPDRLGLIADITLDCIVDYKDVDAMMGDWLDYDYTITTPSNPGDVNLLGCWNFDACDVTDSSGKGHHGTIVQGDAKTSISFVYDAVRDSNVLDVNNIADVNNSVVDCGGDACDVGDPCWANLTEQVSLAAWFTLDDIHSDDQYLITKGNTWQITTNGTSDEISSFHNVLSPQELTTTRKVMDGKWHHVAITYDLNGRPERKLYLDGGLVERAAQTGGPLNVHIATFVIGGRLSATFTERGWDGKIDDVRLYDDVLTPEEVAYLAGYAGPVYFEVPSPANLTDAGDPCNSRFVNFKDFNFLVDIWDPDKIWMWP